MIIKPRITPESKREQELLRKKSEKIQKLKEWTRNHPEEVKFHKQKWYLKNADRINDARAIKERVCNWCGSDISYLRPRNKRFCQPGHKRLFYNARKREWAKQNYEKNREKILVELRAKRARAKRLSAI